MSEAKDLEKAKLCCVFQDSIILDFIVLSFLCRAIEEAYQKVLLLIIKNIFG